MEVYNTILKRRSIRKYLDKDLTDKQIEKLLKAAMAAPSARGQQTWMFYVLKDKEIQTEVKNLSRHYNFNSPIMILVASNQKQLIKDDTFWIQDLSAATQNILLTATEMNLGTVWCGVYPKLDAVSAFQKILKIEEHIIPMALIHVGYPDEDKDPRTRYDKERVVTI